MLNFKRYVPFANRVLIRRAETVTKTKGGILLPEQQQQETQYGEVLATGPGLQFTNGTVRPTNVKAGQTVLLPTYAGVKLKLADANEYWVYRDDDILGILEEPVVAAKK
jgi:chaperonin GroES